LARCLFDFRHGFLLGSVEEATGVDDDGICLVFIRHEAQAIFRE
jgi:hypothetical protein